MKFNKNAEPVYTDDPWYDLTSGGYIKPSELLTDQEEIEKVENAIKTIEEFFEDAEEAGVIIFE